MRFIFALLVVLKFCLKLSAQDLYVDFENVAAGTSAGLSIMGSISRTNGTAVSFAYTGSGNITVESGDPGSQGLLRPVTVNGTSYTNAAPTRHLLVKADNTVSTPKQFEWTHIASLKVSMGCSITLSNFTGLGSFYNPFGIDGGSVFAYLSLINDATPTMQAETNSNIGATINVFNNRAIWVTALFDSANRTCIFDFYNQTNMALLGRSTAPVPLNSTVTKFFYGITDAHSKDAGTVYRLGSLILYTNGTKWPVWPGGNLQIPTNSTSTAVTAALAASANGDSIILPATNQTWTSGVTVSKNNLNISGVSPSGRGTNETVILADGSINAFMVTGTGNTFSNMQVRGDGTTDEAVGFYNAGYYNRYSRVYLRELDVALFCEAPGLLDNSVVNDNWRLARVIFGNPYFDLFFPLAWNSTNFFVFEDSLFYWTSAKNQTGSQVFISSQEGQAFVVRHCYFELSNSSTQIQPWIDYHGDHDPIATSDRRPGTGLQIYSNYIKDVAGSISGSKFVDVRGGRSLIYSNRWVGSSFSSGDGIVYREEHPEDVPDYRVNNSYEWQNYHGTLGTTAIPVNDDGVVMAGVAYFTTPLSPLVQIPYPHPQTGLAPQDAPNPGVQATIGIGRGVRVEP